MAWNRNTTGSPSELLIHRLNDEGKRVETLHFGRAATWDKCTTLESLTAGRQTFWTPRGAMDAQEILQDVLKEFVPGRFEVERVQAVGERQTVTRWATHAHEDALRSIEGEG